MSWGYMLERTHHLVSKPNAILSCQPTWGVMVLVLLALHTYTECVVDSNTWSLRYEFYQNRRENH